MRNKKYKSAEIIGKGLAVLQHNFDKLFEWGFKEIKKQSNKKPESKTESGFIKGLKKVGGYLGVMGEQYYKKYEDLKKKEKK